MKKLSLILFSLAVLAATRADVPAALPRFVNLGAGKCIPCRQMAPVREAIARDYAGQVDVVYIDIGEDREAARHHRIRVIPTQILADAAGRELFRHEGYWPREAIVAKMRELGMIQGAAAPSNAERR